jgi:branched-chain amino acid transport system permease protein
MSRTATIFSDPPVVKPAVWVAPLRASWPLLLALVVCTAMFVFILPRVNAYQQDRVANCGVAIILAVSLTVVNGFTGQFSIGHSGFMAVGGYAAAALMYYGTYHCFHDTEFHGGRLSWTGSALHFPGSHLIDKGDLLFLASLLFGAVVAALIGWVVGLPSLRLRGDYLAIVTLGFCEIVRVVIQSTPDQLAMRPPPDPDADSSLVDTTQYLGDKHLVQELHHLGGALGFSGAPSYSSVFWITLAALVTLGLTIRLKYSSYGRGMLSIREDDIAAQAVGVNTTRLKVRAFMYSAFFAGLAGGLFSLRSGNINAGEMGFQRSFDFIIMVVLGGLGSISGAAIAAVFLTLLPEWLRDIPPGPWGLVALGIATAIIPRMIRGKTGVILAITLASYGAYRYRDLIDIAPADYRLVIYSLLLIVTMILRPQGLFGVHEVWDYYPMRWRWWMGRKED